jgi:transcriptional antiterminator RfaH
MAAFGKSQTEFLVCWYLIHTKPAREEVAEFNLLRQGYQVYYPRLLRPKRHRGNWVDQVAALFPRYLFFGLAPSQDLGPVRSTVGVANIVRFGNAYAVVPARIVEDLRTRADPETGLHRLQQYTQFEPGSNVRIVAGVFDGLEGVFQRESGDERVVLLLRLLGHDTHVEVPARFVLPQLDSQTKLVAR